MQGQIANYCPIVSRNTIVKNSTSIESIWQVICLHFGFQTTEAHFIDFNDIHLETDERPEDLYQCLMAFTEDCLLRANVLTHHREKIEEDEEPSPSLENFVVLTWLCLINPKLPKLVKQCYGIDLRTRTLAFIKPEISQALKSLLEEIRTAGDAKILCSTASPFNRRTPNAIRTIVLCTPPTPITLWPGNFIELDLPNYNLADSDYIIESCLDSPSVRRCNGSDMWPPPSVLPCIAGKLHIPNLSNEPHTFNHHEHYCQVAPLVTTLTSEQTQASLENIPTSTHRACPTSSKFSHNVE